MPDKKVVARAVVTGTFEVKLSERWSDETTARHINFEAAELARTMLVKVLQPTDVRLVGPLKVRQVLVEEEP